MFKINTIDVSLYNDYKKCKITLHEVAREFCKCGWTNFVDEKFAARKMQELSDKDQ